MLGAHVFRVWGTVAKRTQGPGGRREAAAGLDGIHPQGLDAAAGAGPAAAAVSGAPAVKPQRQGLGRICCRSHQRPRCQPRGGCCCLRGRCGWGCGRKRRVGAGARRTYHHGIRRHASLPGCTLPPPRLLARRPLPSRRRSLSPLLSRRCSLCPLLSQRCTLRPRALVKPHASVKPRALVKPHAVVHKEAPHQGHDGASIAQGGGVAKRRAHHAGGPPPDHVPPVPAHVAGLKVGPHVCAGRGRSSRVGRRGPQGGWVREQRGMGGLGFPVSGGLIMWRGSVEVAGGEASRRGHACARAADGQEPHAGHPAK